MLCLCSHGAGGRGLGSTGAPGENHPGEPMGAELKGRSRWED